MANMARSLVIVFDDVAEATISTSNHLEWASTTTRNIFPMNGPA